VSVVVVGVSGSGWCVSGGGWGVVVVDASVVAMGVVVVDVSVVAVGGGGGGCVSGRSGGLRHSTSDEFNVAGAPLVTSFTLLWHSTSDKFNAATLHF